MARTNLTRSLVLTKADEQLIPPHVRALYAAGVIDKKELDTYIGKVADATRVAYESNFQPGMLQPPAPKEESTRTSQFPSEAPSTASAMGLSMSARSEEKDINDEVAALAEESNWLDKIDQATKDEKYKQSLLEESKKIREESWKKFQEQVARRRDTLVPQSVTEAINQYDKLTSALEEASKDPEATAKKRTNLTERMKELQAKSLEVKNKYQYAERGLEGGTGVARAVAQGVSNWEQYIPQVTAPIGGVLAGGAAVYSGAGAPLAGAAYTGGNVAGAVVGSIPIARRVYNDSYAKIILNGGTPQEAADYAKEKTTIEFGAEVVASLIPGANAPGARTLTKMGVKPILAKAGSAAGRQVVEENLTDLASQTADIYALGSGNESEALQRTREQDLPLNEQGQFDPTKFAEQRYQTALAAAVGGAGTGVVTAPVEINAQNKAVQERANLGKSAFAQAQQAFQSGAINENDLITERQRLAAALQIEPELIADNKSIADLTVRRNQSDLRKITDSVANELVQPTGDAAFDAGQQSAINLSNEQPLLSTPFEVPLKAPVSPKSERSQEGLYEGSGFNVTLPVEAPVRSERDRIVEEIKAQQPVAANVLSGQDVKALEKEDIRLRNEIASLESKRGLVGADPAFNVEREITMLSQRREGIRQTLEQSRQAKTAQNRIGNLTKRLEKTKEDTPTFAQNFNAPQPTATVTAGGANVQTGQVTPAPTNVQVTTEPKKRVNLTEAQKERTRKVTEIAAQELYARGADVTYQAVKTRAQELLADKEQDVGKIEARIADEVRLLDKRNGKGRVPLTNLVKKTEAAVAKDVEKRSADVAEAARDLTKFLSQEDTDNLIKSGVVTLKPTIKDEKGANVQGETYRGKFDINVESIKYETTEDGKTTVRNPKARQALLEAVASHEGGHLRDFGTKGEKKVALLANLVGDKAIDKLNSVIEAEAQKKGGLSDIARNAIERANKQTDNPAREEIANYFTEELTRRGYEGKLGPVWKAMNEMIAGARDNFSKVTGKTIPIRLQDLGYIAKQELKQAAKRGVERDTADTTKKKSVVYPVASERAREEIKAGKGIIDPIYNKKAVEVSDRNATLNPEKITSGATLGDVMNHDELYSYLPKLKGYTVTVNDDLEAGTARYDSYTKEVIISGKDVRVLNKAAQTENGKNSAFYKNKEKDVLKSILHEAQHGIQASAIADERGTHQQKETDLYNKRTILTQQMDINKAHRELRADNASWWMYLANAGEVQARAIEMVFDGTYDTYTEAAEALSKQFPRLIRNAKDRDAFIDWWNKEVKGSEDERGLRLRSISEEDSPKTKQSYTININGVNRPTVNANGQRIAETDEQIRNFWQWFGDSKVVDSDGKPLVMYHGTNRSTNGQPFESFDAYGSNYGLFGQGSYFTDNPSVASSYTSKGKGDTPTVYPVYLKVASPIDMDKKANKSAWQEQFPASTDYHEGGDTNESWYRAAEDSLRDEGLPRYEGAEIIQDGIRSMGYDGITHIGGGRIRENSVEHRVFIIFEPEQVKSAIGNRGTFDPNDSRIHRSLAEDETNPVTKPSYTFTQPLTKIGKGLFGTNRPAEARIAEEAEGGYIRRKQEEALNIVNALKKAMRSQGLNQSEVDEEWNRMNLTQTDSDENEFGDVALALNDLRKLIDDLSWKIIDIHEQSGIPVSEENRKGIEANIGGYISRSFDINSDKNYGKKLLKKAAVKGSVEERIVEDLEGWLQTNIVDSLNNLDSLSDAEIDSLYKKLFGETKDTLGKLNKRIAEKTEGVENTGFKDEQNALKKSAEKLEGKRVALRTAKQQELENFRGFVSDESLTKTLRDDLLRIGKKSNLASYYAGAARNEGILKYKEMIPEIILKAWGEQTGAVESALTTIMRQSKLVASTQFQMDLLARSPDSFGEARTETLNAQLSKDKGKYGPLAGMYVTPEMKTYLESHAVIQEELDTLLYQLHTNAGQKKLKTVIFNAVADKWVKAGSLYKAYTILGNIQSYIFNTVALGQNTVSNALPFKDLDYTATDGSKQNSADWMWQFVWDVAGGTIKPTTGEVYKDAIEFDFLGAGLSGDLNDAFRQDMKQFLATQKNTPTNLAKQAVVKTFNGIKVAADAGFTLPELFGTVANFVNEQNYLRKLWTAEGREFTERELKLEAADRTKKTSMNRGRAFPVAKFLDQTQLTAFLTFFAETGRATVGGFLTGISDMRHASDLRNQGKTEAADIAYKQGSMRVAGGLAMFGLTQAMLAGLTKVLGHKFGEEEDEKEEYLPEDQRANLPWLVVVGETKEGTKKVFDVSKLDTYSALSNPIVSLLRGEPANAASQVSDLAFMNPLLSMAYKQFVAGEVRNRENTAWVNELAVKIGLANAVDAKTLDAITNVAVGVTPPIVKRSLTEAMFPTEDIGGEMARLLTYAGSYLMEVNPKTQYPSALGRVKTELDAARQELNRVMTKENISEEAARTYIRKYHNRLKEIVDKESPLIQGAVSAGEDKKRIKQLATGIDKGVQESLFNGIYKPKEMSKTWLNLSELNKEVGTPEEKIKIAARYKRNKDLYEKLFKEMYNGGKQ